MKLLLMCAFFVSQSYCADAGGPKKTAQFERIMFGLGGEITGIVVTQEQAAQTGPLLQKLWDMSCQNLTCAACPRCVGSQLAIATQENSQARIDAANAILRVLVSQAEESFKK